MNIESVNASNDDRAKDQEELIKELDKPDTLKSFVEACKNIGQKAVSIDNDFIAIKHAFEELVKKYGKEFPKVKSDFVPRWDGLMDRWSGPKGILWSSRDLAAKTAASLTDFGINLQLVAEIKSEKDLKEAQAELQQYVDSHPVKEAKIVEDGFKNLRKDIKKFSQDFKKYIKDQGQSLSKEAEVFEAEIEKYQAEVDSINEEIKKVLIALGCTAAFGIALVINAAFLVAYLVRRKKAQDNLDVAKANLERIKKDQNALAAMQVDFENLKPHIDDICFKLGIFAEVYSFMSEQSILIKNELDKGMEILSSWIFKIKLELLRKQVAPLREGMREYATQIVKP